MTSLRHAIARAISAAVVLGTLTAVSTAGLAQARVELELLLAVDASGSVDAAEFDLQVHGLAAAFRDPDVVSAIAAAPNGVAVGLMQWSSPGQQIMAVDWSLVSDQYSAAELARRITAAGRVILGETAIAAALSFATDELGRNAFAGRRQIIDLSGDGATNWGPSPAAARNRAIRKGITINGLAILNEQPDLGRYYLDNVVGGLGAFVMTADNYHDFAKAMRLKLIEEIAGSAAASTRLPPAHIRADQTPKQ